MKKFSAAGRILCLLFKLSFEKSDRKIHGLESS